MGKFFDPLVLDGNTWITRWTQIQGAPQETNDTFQAALSSNPAHIAGLFTNGLRWAILKGIDTNPNNLVGSGTFVCSRGSVHCYMRLETNQTANMLRLTVKTGSADITGVIR